MEMTFIWDTYSRGIGGGRGGPPPGVGVTDLLGGEGDLNLGEFDRNGGVVALTGRTGREAGPCTLLGATTLTTFLFVVVVVILSR